MCRIEGRDVFPGKNVVHPLSGEPLDADLTVAGHAFDASTSEGLQLFGSEMEGGAFHIHLSCRKARRTRAAGLFCVDGEPLLIEQGNLLDGLQPRGGHPRISLLL